MAAPHFPNPSFSPHGKVKVSFGDHPGPCHHWLKRTRPGPSGTRRHSGQWSQRIEASLNSCRTDRTSFRPVTRHSALGSSSVNLMMIVPASQVAVPSLQQAKRSPPTPTILSKCERPTPSPLPDLGVPQFCQAVPGLLVSWLCKG